MYIDYSFQTDAVKSIVDRLFNKDEPSLLLVSPTGSGKTVIAGKACKEIISLKSNKILCILNLQVLVKQTYRELEELGVSVSVVHNEITGDEHGDFIMGYGGDVVISMPDTFCNVLQGSSPDFILEEGFSPCLLWVDEAHKGTSELFQIIRDNFPQAKVLGTTATPYRENNKEGEHIKTWYGNRLLYTISTNQLIELGCLTKPVYKMYGEQDSIVETWLHETAGLDNRQTVVFTQDTDASYKFLEAFTQAGISAEVVTAGSDIEIDGKRINPQTVKQRNEINARFEKGITTVLISVNALCEGWNVKKAFCCILARNVGNPALYDQMIGRVMRSFAGDAIHQEKVSSLVLDFYGNIKKHGYVEDRDWDAVKEGRTIGFTDRKNMTNKQFISHGSVRHVCESCHNVYDLKKFRCCPNKTCNTVPNFSLTTTTKDAVKIMFGIDTKHGLPSLLNMVRGLSSIADVNMREASARARNKQYGKTVFNMDGTVTEEFAFLQELAASNSLPKTVNMQVKYHM